MSFVSTATEAGSGIGNFVGGLLNPVLGSNQTTTTTTKPKDNTTMVIAIVVVIVVVAAFFLFRKPKTTA